MLPARTATTVDTFGVRQLDADSREWLRRLRSVGRTRDEALGQLRDLLLRAAHGELRRRSAQLRVTGPELDDLAHQAADDAVMYIIRKLEEFRGDSRFTTWAYKFVVLEVSAKVGRHHWLRRPVTMVDDDAWAKIPDRFGVDPADQAEAADLVHALRRVVQVALTPRQRRVFLAIVVEGVPLDALALELASSRNAIYKTMFDARRKIRLQLVADGYLHDEDPRGR